MLPDVVADAISHTGHLPANKTWNTTISLSGNSGRLVAHNYPPLTHLNYKHETKTDSLPDSIPLPTIPPDTEQQVKYVSVPCTECGTDVTIPVFSYELSEHR